jgi:hypothetical protein
MPFIADNFNNMPDLTWPKDGDWVYALFVIYTNGDHELYKFPTEENRSSFIGQNKIPHYSNGARAVDTLFTDYRHRKLASPDSP